MIAVNPIERTLDVEGLTTFEQIVDATLPYGLVPPVTPELKHITIGGAICGIGIESTSFRHGFVHDSLIEADVLVAKARSFSAPPSTPTLIYSRRFQTRTARWAMCCARRSGWSRSGDTFS